MSQHETPQVLTDHKLKLDGGRQWVIRIVGERVTIIDDEGRQRGMYYGLKSVAIHLAMALADRPAEFSAEASDLMKAMAARS